MVGTKTGAASEELAVLVRQRSGGGVNHRPDPSLIFATSETVHPFFREATAMSGTAGAGRGTKLTAEALLPSPPVTVAWRAAAK